MTRNCQKIDLGTAEILSEKTVEAGSFATLRYVYTAGHPIDDTGFIKIAFRYAGDFGSPQFGIPSAPNYCSVSTTGNCRLEARWDPKGHTRPWGRALYLKVMGGYLDRGDRVKIVFGDDSGGSPGWRIQSFCEETFEFRTLVDPIATYEFKELPVSPVIRICPGPPVKAVCIAPTNAIVGKPVTVHFKLEDRWGNPIRNPRTVEIGGFAEPGVQRIELTDSETGLTARSNPVVVSAADSKCPHLWADFHGQSEETIGSNSIDDYFRFARDISRLDIAAHQGNDFQVTDSFWETINHTTASFYEPGRFVTFPGYEWSGNTPLGGDRNIYFVDEGGSIVHSSTDLLPEKCSAFPVAGTATELFGELSSQAEPTAFAFAHVGGRYADMAMHNESIELAVEIHSAWGTFEWLFHDAIQRGYRVGICANSDGHKGRPGSSYPGARKFGSYGGLTCVRSDTRDREGILKALRARHFYATTGNRSVIELTCSDSAGHSVTMGDVLKVPSLPIVIRCAVRGTAPLRTVQLWNGATLVEEKCAVAEPDSNRLTILWQGAEVRGRDRQVTWDGEIAVEGSRILDVKPVNFWNPDAQPQQVGDSRIQWQSITTGGIAGVVLTLSNPDAARIAFNSVQATFTVQVADLRREKFVKNCGGLSKHVALYMLPATPPDEDMDVEFRIAKLASGDNPLFVKICQEDGHMAWTSPVYACAGGR
jgi:hypothetical protein